MPDRDLWGIVLAGTTVGGAIDLASGGATMGAGAVFGGATALIGELFLKDRLRKPRLIVKCDQLLGVYRKFSENEKIDKMEKLIYKIQNVKEMTSAEIDEEIAKIEK